MIRPGFFNLIIFLRLQGFRVSASLKCQEVHPILPMVALFFFLLTVGCLLGACLADPGIIPRREVSGCVWVFGGRLGVVDSCSDVSSMDGFTMLMFQFHAWVQGNLLGESYLFHPCSSYFIHWLVGTAQTEFRMPRRRYADILVPPFLPQMARSSFLGWADGVWGINMCRFRSNRTNHSVNYILHMNAFMTLSSKTSR